MARPYGSCGAPRSVSDEPRDLADGPSTPEAKAAALLKRTPIGFRQDGHGLQAPDNGCEGSAGLQGPAHPAALGGFLASEMGRTGVERIAGAGTVFL